MSIGSRKYSGSASFLNKLQRSAPAETHPPHETASEEAPVAAEAVLEVLCDVNEIRLDDLEKKLHAASGGLEGAIGELLKFGLVRFDGASSQAVVALTEVGMRAANFSRIARK